MTPPSLTRNSIARLAADTSNLAIGLVTSVIIARWLGADGKGILSSISYLAGLVANLGLLGLAETQIVLVGQKRTTLERAYSSTIMAGLLLGIIASAVLWGIGAFEFRRDWSEAAIPLLITALALPFSMIAQVATNILNAREQIIKSSVLVFVSAISLLALNVGMVILLRWDLIGASAAAAASIFLTMAVGMAMVRRSGVQLSMTWDGAYLRDAARIGIRLQLAALFVNLAGRFDQLLVYTFSGASDAGIYSVALTYGSLGFLPPFALAYATFPRLSALEPAEASELTARGARLAVVITAIIAIPLALLAPFVIVFAFGPAFERASAPAATLICGSVVLAAQYFLARGRAARGDTRLLLQSFALTAVVMIALDCVLIPRFGLMGAAFASIAGNVAGLIRCVAASGWPGGRATLLVPRTSELADAARSLRGLLRPGR